MKFSVIIVSYNTKELLRNCLESLFRRCPSGLFEVIIVDNASADGSCEMIEQEFAGHVRLIRNPINAGFGAANNLGAKSASGEYLFLLNSDTIIDEDILTPMHKYLDANVSVGIVSPKLLLSDGTEQAYAYGRFQSIWGAAKDKLIGRKNEPYNDVEWVSGAAMAVRRGLFEKLRGFDENFFMYFEDMDLCKRASEEGFRTEVFSQARITHLLNQSPSGQGRRKKMYYESQDYYYKKHFGSLQMYLMRLARLPLRIFSKF